MREKEKGGKRRKGRDRKRGERGQGKERKTRLDRKG